MSLLNKKVNGSLQDGKYMIQLLGAREIPAKEGVSERIAVLITIPKLEREMEISMFEQQLDFMVRDLINEYFPNSSMSIVDLLDALKDQTIPMWVKRKTMDNLESTGTRTYVNYYFHEVFESAVAPVDSSDEPLQFN